MQQAETFLQLIKLIERKVEFDKQNPWYQGVETYLSGLQNEVIEVADELKMARRAYLEDELADVLWNYLNLIGQLEKQNQASLVNVINRCLVKYQQRLDTIENGGCWDTIKQQQKAELAKVLNDSDEQTDKE
ncbi:hypothetical protein N7931_10920 [Catenovulum sp. 2E275]|uniref:MazG nucleotide pyrophosphohydrolase domain-containing protein n=1 Tax=Catenovulum sp. 2E275 TaxID=2980497 RepID=UPI0021D32B54|nr:MazG nucleotide pyrophosphohydrolase domain-containing protein [Catenovulum sp. 2E275]MCU4676141.1 hypothetical protein [Catenovulum sp. 2E275]